MATALFNRPFVSYSRVNFSLALHSIDWPNDGLRPTHSAGCVFHVRFVFVGRSCALSFAKTLQAHKSHPVTMLQARPHAIHFKRILDFGEGQVKSTTYGFLALLVLRQAESPKVFFGVHPAFSAVDAHLQPQIGIGWDAETSSVVDESVGVSRRARAIAYNPPRGHTGYQQSHF